MNVIRVDGGGKIGIGHIVRCLNIAKMLAKMKHRVVFLSKIHDKSIVPMIENQFELVLLPVLSQVTVDQKTWLGSSAESDIDYTLDYISDKKINLLIVDHYMIDREWESKIRPFVNKIMVIDDLANRTHDCDILLDYNITYNDYTHLVPKTCDMLIGPKYYIFSDKINKYSSKRRIRSSVRRVCICFGGSNCKTPLQKIVDFLEKNYKLYENITFDIITSDTNIISKTNFVNKIKVHPILSPDEYYNILSNTDLIIGSPSSSIYERCYLGIPTILVNVAENQIEIGKKVAEEKLGIQTGDNIEFNIDRICQLILNIDVKEYSDRCIRLIDNPLYLKSVMETLLQSSM